MLKNIRLAILMATLFASAHLHAQDKRTDSLELTLQNPKMHDTVKLYKLLMFMAENYTEHDKTFHHLNHQLGRISEKSYYGKSTPEVHKIYAQYLSNYYNVLMAEYGAKRDVVKALDAINRSIAITKSEQLYFDMNYALISKGSFLAKIGEYEKAIACVFQALRYFEDEDNRTKETASAIAYTQGIIASIYSEQGNHKQSIAYNKKALAFYNSPQKKDASNVYTQCTTYSNIGSSYLELRNYPEAWKNFERGLQIAEEIGDTMTASVILSKMARVKTGQLQFAEAEKLLKQALAIDSGDLATANAYVKMGELFYRKKDFAKADFYLSKGLSLSKQAKILSLQDQASDLLFNVSKENKDFEKALEMHVFHDQLADSTKAEASKNALAQQELRYDFEKKELNYKLATQQKTAAKNNWLIALSGVLVLLLLGGYFYYRNSKQKQAITVLEKDQIKQRLLISQMNPHFIFNSIQNIRGLIHDNQNSDAVNYLDKFSRLTRQILENSNETYISLAEEIEMTENYLAIQQLLYNRKFDYTVTVDEALDVESIFLPPMLTQPFIENAIKHGLVKKTANGKVDIDFYLKGEKLFFEVADNGKGFDGGKNSENHKSMAMAITKERLVHYTKNQDFIVQTGNLTDVHQKVVGAKVGFEIPYIYEN